MKYNSKLWSFWSLFLVSTIMALGPFTPSDVAHTWWIIVLIIVFIIAFAFCSLVSFWAPDTSNWRRIIFPQSAMVALKFVLFGIFGTSGSVYSVMILTLPVLGPIVAAVALWILDWHREWRRDKLVKEGNFVVEIDDVGDGQRMFLKVGDDNETEGGFLSPRSRIEMDFPGRGRAVSSWTLGALPEGLEDTIEAIKEADLKHAGGPRAHSKGRTDHSPSIVLRPSVSRRARLARSTVPRRLSTMEGAELYKSDNEYIPLGDGYSLKVNVGRAPEHRVYLTAKRQL